MKRSPQVGVPCAGSGGASVAALLGQAGFGVWIRVRVTADYDASSVPLIVLVNNA